MSEPGEYARQHEALEMMGVLAAIFLPPFGFFIGLALIDKSKAAAPLVGISLVMTTALGISWWWVV